MTLLVLGLLPMSMRISLLPTVLVDNDRSVSRWGQD